MADWRFYPEKEKTNVILSVRRINSSDILLEQKFGKKIKTASMVMEELAYLKNFHFNRYCEGKRCKNYKETERRI